MKNYYKTLGIRATASPEDIHTRWIELMRKFHPDRRRKGGEQDERIKEINEAYEVLKHSSARSHYDLQRTYYRKKRNLRLQRLILPAAILFIFLFFGLIYFQKPKTSAPPESRTISSRFSIPKLLNVPKALNDPNDTNDITDAKGLTQSPIASHPSPVSHSPSPIAKLDINDINHPNVFTQTNQIAHSLSPIAKLDPNDPNDLNHLNGYFVQLTPPPLLATEEEVKHFFALYRQRYNRKDIDALLSLFSPRAVQNQRDGFDEIKKTYSHFFDQSQQLRYYMKDMRIEIYQNAVEVWARYEIDQIMKKRGKEKAWRGETRWILVKEDGALKIRFLDYKPYKSP